MKTYVGVKVVEAEPMNLDEYNKFREGYLVKYPPDGYFAMEKSRAEMVREQFRHSIFGMNTD